MALEEITWSKISSFNLVPRHSGQVDSTIKPSIHSLIQELLVSKYLLSKLLTIPSYLDLVFLVLPVLET